MWTDERVEKLTKLWAEGLSASQIAAQLGDVSRNAVIGKVHRLNLPGRAKSGGAVAAARPAAPKRPAAPVAPAAPRATTFQQARPAPAAPRAAARPAPAAKDDFEFEPMVATALPTAGDFVLPTSLKLALTELTERTCKWPVGDPLSDDFHFCGCEASESSPYCKFHAKMAYQPVSERRRA